MWAMILSRRGGAKTSEDEDEGRLTKDHDEEGRLTSLVRSPWGMVVCPSPMVQKKPANAEHQHPPQLATSECVRPKSISTGSSQSRSSSSNQSAELHRGGKEADCIFLEGV